MRRTLLAAAALAVGTMGITVPVAHAETFDFHGVVTDANGGAPLAGIEVIAELPSQPGAVWSTTTAADGTWSYAADDEEYLVYFDGGVDYQSGYRNCFGYVAPIDLACTLGPGWEAPTYMYATWATGYILDGTTLSPVAGAVVTATREDGVTVLGSATTASDGSYRVTGITHEEIGLFVDGSAVGYGSGWFACVAGPVVPTFGEACTHVPGQQGDRYLDAVAIDPPRLRLHSWFRRSITLIVRDPGTDAAIDGFELVCTNRRTGDVTTATYPAHGGTRFGFRRGNYVCTAHAIGPFGTGPDSRPLRVHVR